MRLILCRHGNTFNPGQKVIRAGAHEDLSLVDHGVKQAHAVAKYLRDTGQIPVQVFAGPLKRTRTTAEVIAKDLGLINSVVIENSLNELDYGSWAGLSDPEIIEKFGESELRAWNEHSVWPRSAGFQPAEQQVRSEVQTFVDLILDHYKGDECILAVTSNGRLRYFLDLVPGLFESFRVSAAFKVGTGNLCIFEKCEGGFKLVSWNQSPVEP